MKQVDLITGLLGAGKTTFLADYARYLRGRGENLAAVVNDHGAVSVDSVLLREMLGEDFHVETVIDDGDPGCHKRRTRAKLIALSMEGYDRVVVEPSGVFEPEEFFDMLREPPLDSWYEPGNVIAILESGLGPELSSASRFLLVSQLADAGAILMSKTDTATPEERGESIHTANAALAEYKCSRRLGEDVITKPWREFSAEDWETLARCGYSFHDYERRAPAKEEFSTLYFLNTGITLDGLSGMLAELFGGKYGRVVRVKGFLPGKEGWVRFNATPRETEVLPSEYTQRCLIVIGEELDKEKLDRVIRGEEA